MNPRFPIIDPITSISSRLNPLDVKLQEDVQKLIDLYKAGFLDKSQVDSIKNLLEIPQPEQNGLIEWLTL